LAGKSTGAFSSGTSSRIYPPAELGVLLFFPGFDLALVIGAVGDVLHE
jgi:hypothetical protein